MIEKGAVSTQYARLRHQSSMFGTYVISLHSFQLFPINVPSISPAIYPRFKFSLLSHISLISCASLESLLPVMCPAPCSIQSKSFSYDVSP